MPGQCKKIRQALYVCTTATNYVSNELWYLWYVPHHTVPITDTYKFILLILTANLQNIVSKYSIIPPPPLISYYRTGTRFFLASSDLF